ncbi:MAG: hypothetical protein HY943_12555 [Gammaproteobacteria bacterium]|nr:hypothetical protein [Gammaproteobacteria bacterium]
MSDVERCASELYQPGSRIGRLALAVARVACTKRILDFAAARIVTPGELVDARPERRPFTKA